MEEMSQTAGRPGPAHLEDTQGWAAPCSRPPRAWAPGCPVGTGREVTPQNGRGRAEPAPALGPASPLAQGREPAQPVRTDARS